jgi:hypothetical protein
MASAIDLPPKAFIQAGTASKALSFHIGRAHFKVPTADRERARRSNLQGNFLRRQPHGDPSIVLGSAARPISRPGSTTYAPRGVNGEPAAMDQQPSVVPIYAGRNRNGMAWETRAR